ncbi:NapC/NirT family cytochrome c [Geomonas sp. RF6]|uniref:NapC/NirT family cytochrome c n=1 Tax=Geomonas sp. RF6 TaxID=2897342 RepID=UPI001E4C4903|nr:NapC/NirT family cytochrome c [Geomonas sp. RF6]UFS71940.1 NapC/NirT family cytochrome c [Geomonas sp. RF6]
MKGKRACFAVTVAAILCASLAMGQSQTFPQGSATPSESCGKCHRAIYREFAFGFGSDILFKPTTMPGKEGDKLSLPANVSGTATAHAIAGVDPYPVHSREAEEGGKSCNVCHYPESFAIPDMEAPELSKPKARPKDKEAGGLTCASCHLTPEGKIRGAHVVKAPHDTVADPAIHTSAMCAYCHAMGKRVVGKQTQTFLEWREDFYKPTLGLQQCQDCHMPRTMRKIAEEYDNPERAVARHLWTGGRSQQRLASALGLVVTQPLEGKPNLAFHVINIGAGHSVPTGSNRRAVYLKVEVTDRKGKLVAGNDWMFAPWYGARPDDKKFLEEDKKRPDAVAAMQADAQGPHESTIRAGEERTLPWTPKLKPGEYTVKACLIYDLNRYNARTFTDDQTEMNSTTLTVRVRR